MRHRRVLPLIISFAAIALAGCLPDQKQDIAACQGEADRFFLSHRAVNTDDPRSQYIITCMAIKGYDFTVTPDKCDGQHPLAIQAACYIPTNWLFRIVSRVLRQ